MKLIALGATCIVATAQDSNWAGLRDTEDLQKLQREAKGDLEGQSRLRRHEVTGQYTDAKGNFYKGILKNNLLNG